MYCKNVNENSARIITVLLSIAALAFTYREYSHSVRRDAVEQALEHVQLRLNSQSPYSSAYQRWTAWYYKNARLFDGAASRPAGDFRCITIHQMGKDFGPEDMVRLGDYFKALDLCMDGGHCDRDTVYAYLGEDARVLNGVTHGPACFSLRQWTATEGHAKFEARSWPIHQFVQHYLAYKDRAPSNVAMNCEDVPLYKPAEMLNCAEPEKVQAHCGRCICGKPETEKCL